MLNMPVNVERCRSELDDLETELDGWSHPNPPGVDLWTHKMYALIGEILDPNHALAIRLSGMRWGAGNRSTRQLAAQFGQQLMINPAEAAAFANDKERAKGIIAALRWELERLASTSGAFQKEDDAVAGSDPAPSEPTIFLVHGHAAEIKYEVAHFIEQETGKWPIILHEQADRSQTIIEKLERHASGADFAVVLLTADDEGRARGEDDLTNRARQNVVFEHGYFIGKFGRQRVVALYEDGVELPSDLSGVLYKPLADNWKMELLGELRAAGIVTTGPGVQDRGTRAKPFGSTGEGEEGDPSGNGQNETRPGLHGTVAAHD